jgi:hypothetical protein
VLTLARRAQHHRCAAQWAGGRLLCRLLVTIRRLNPLLLPAFCIPCRSKSLAIPAGSDELPFERRDLLIQQVVRLVDQTDERIGNDRGVLVL